MATNGTIIQFFHWYYPNTGILWKEIGEKAKSLAEMGFTALWTPPAYKGSAGVNDVGYSIYDLYDLGEFDQKESIRTKYGTKNELIHAIREAHANRLQVYGDIVFNQKAGGDDIEFVKIVRVKKENANFVLGESDWIEAWTVFNFPGRNNKYSDFKWNWEHFDGVDYANNYPDEKDPYGNPLYIYKFVDRGKDWEKLVGDENGNYDYLMCNDLDMNSAAVRTELSRWGKWFVELTDIDGFRIDAVKHIEYSFFRNWLEYLRKQLKEYFFAVGEYWNPDHVNDLLKYIEMTKGCMSLFDAPLHKNFYEASRNYYDMRCILNNTLVQINPCKAVTLVDNHDTQPCQALESWVDYWFKPLAYAIILLREQGYPCVFYPDLYGAGYTDHGFNIDLAPVPKLTEMIRARKLYAYGNQNDYFDHSNMVGWTREGDNDHENSGLAVLLTNGSGGSKWMYMGKNSAGNEYHDYLNNRTETVKINKDGWGEFWVNEKSVSVWVKQK
ncbi:alpha-amylase [Parabacteroides sp. FAFU027]|uniref:alpha-amylase n=1 Tax=Parabacteroides sp. FAFU027 TaxID=2922715 RepID=UPI001FB03907|nr:alpha-amylase [Parabacteroides sp. FAFU027]